MGNRKYGDWLLELLGIAKINAVSKGRKERIKREQKDRLNKVSTSNTQSSGSANLERSGENWRSAFCPSAGVSAATKYSKSLAVQTPGVSVRIFCHVKLFLSPSTSCSRGDFNCLHSQNQGDNCQIMIHWVGCCLQRRLCVQLELKDVASCLLLLIMLCCLLLFSFFGGKGGWMIIFPVCWHMTCFLSEFGVSLCFLFRRVLPIILSVWGKKKLNPYASSKLAPGNKGQSSRSFK